MTKFIFPILVGIAGTIAAFFTDFRERFWEEDDARAKMIAVEDSLRVFFRKTEGPQEMLRDYHREVNSVLIRDTSLIEQTLLVRFWRSDLDKPIQWEYFNIISIMYEEPRTYKYDNKSDWNGENIDWVRPGIRTLLRNIYEYRGVYTISIPRWCD